MTDNSKAEDDLSGVWPGAWQLLCHFHVLQAEWRWLMSKTSQVPEDQRQQCIAAFEQVKHTSSLKGSNYKNWGLEESTY